MPWHVSTRTSLIVARMFPCKPRIYSTMNKAHVRSVPSDERLNISLNFGLEGKQEREFKFNRQKSELLSATLERISSSVSKKTVLKVKKRKTDNGEPVQPPESLVVSMLNGDVQFEEGVTNENAWNSGSILQIGSSKYELDINCPAIRSIKLPECIMAGFPISPIIDAEFVDLEHCKFDWYKAKITEANAGDSPAGSSSNTDTSHKSKTKKIKEWVFLKTGDIYIPDNTDIGCVLKIVCVPSNGSRYGRESECVSKPEVTASPGFCPFEKRHALTENKMDDKGLRVVSYNLLADIYADSDFSRNTLFSHCPPYALSMEYRKQLIVKELKGYNADIICLQEVDRKVFLETIQPALEFEFEGILKVKSENVREGPATFYRKSKFKLINQHDIKLTEELKAGDTHKQMWQTVSQNEELAKKVEERNTLFQVCVFEPVDQPKKCVIVGSTHLFFKPTAGNVRLIQTHVCLKHLEDIKQMYIQQGKDATVMFCGDLNSAPVSGAIDLITSNLITPSHADWFSAGSTEKIAAPTLSHSLDFTSACGYPQYTNFVPAFNGCLDYIFIEESALKIDRVIALPSHEEVTQYTALPNPVFPSDHLALVCDLKWV